MAMNLPTLATGLPKRGLPLHQRQLVELHLAQLGDGGIAELVGADVLDDGAQVAQLAVVVDEAGLLLAGVAIADEFHAFLSVH
jgi:hypothetical protein